MVAQALFYRFWHTKGTYLRLFFWSLSSPKIRMHCCETHGMVRTVRPSRTNINLVTASPQAQSQVLISGLMYLPYTVGVMGHMAGCQHHGSSSGILYTTILTMATMQCSAFCRPDLRSDYFSRLNSTNAHILRARAIMGFDEHQFFFNMI